MQRLVRLIGVFGHTVCFGRHRGSETGKQVYPEVPVLDHRLKWPPLGVAPPPFHTEEPLHVGGHKKGQPLMCGSTCWALFFQSVPPVASYDFSRGLRQQPGEET